MKKEKYLYTKKELSKCLSEKDSPELDFKTYKYYLVTFTMLEKMLKRERLFNKTCLDTEFFDLLEVYWGLEFWRFNLETDELLLREKIK